MTRLVCIVVATLLCVSNTQAQVRTVPNPLYGVTLDNINNPTKETNYLSKISHVPTARIVFDKGTSASVYKKPIQQIRNVAYIMGELIDSSYMKRFKSIADIQTWTNSYVATLGSLVDIWEIGNEINGNWLGSNAFNKMAAMYDIVAAHDYQTALTFFYEGETTEKNNCIDSQGGMFPWIARYFQDYRTTESEKIRLGLDYVLISWYPDQCPGERPDWSIVYTRLASIFPNSKVGFGEIGTANPQNGTSYEMQEISTYYPMQKNLPGLPWSYVGGYFWWYATEELSQSWFLPALNNAIQ